MHEKIAVENGIKLLQNLREKVAHQCFLAQSFFFFLSMKRDRNADVGGRFKDVFAFWFECDEMSSFRFVSFDESECAECIYQ